MHACTRARAHTHRGRRTPPGGGGAGTGLRVRVRAAGRRPGASRLTGGRWEGPARREARGPAREPPGAGKTRLLLPLPPFPLSPQPCLPALSSHLDPSSPSPWLRLPPPKLGPLWPLSKDAAQLRVAHAPSAPPQPRPPWRRLLGCPQATAPTFIFSPAPARAPNCPLAAPQLAPQALPDLCAFCTAALHSQAPLLAAPFLLRCPVWGDPDVPLFEGLRAGTTNSPLFLDHASPCAFSSKSTIFFQPRSPQFPAKNRIIIIISRLQPPLLEYFPNYKKPTHFFQFFI